MSTWPTAEAMAANLTEERPFLFGRDAFKETVNTGFILARSSPRARRAVREWWALVERPDLARYATQPEHEQTVWLHMDDVAIVADARFFSAPTSLAVRHFYFKDWPFVEELRSHARARLRWNVSAG